MSNLIFPFVIVAIYCLYFEQQLAGQTLTTLYSFSSNYNNTNSDGQYPFAGVVISSNKLYGTTYDGGLYGCGSVYSVNIDGTDFTNLHSFTGGLDQGFPYGGLTISGNIIYGTTGGTYNTGGGDGFGTVFAINTDGANFTLLHIFNNSDGWSPEANLICSNGMLYGTTVGGGSLGGGTVFAISTNGEGFATLSNFDPKNNNNFENATGNGPIGSLVLCGGTLYGTTDIGGTGGTGTIFAVNTNGTVFTILHDFSVGGAFPPYANTDGAYILAGLTLCGSNLYGIAEHGGSGEVGTIFALSTNGTQFHTLFDFSLSGPNGGDSGANLVSSGNTLFGMSVEPGPNNSGTLFAIGTNGNNFTLLTTNILEYNAYGYSHPNFILFSNTIYGTTVGGGTWGNGSVFSFTLPKPQLSIAPAGAKAVIAWSANITTFFGLQFTTNLGPSQVWQNVSNSPTVVNGMCVITNVVSCVPTFYRLSD